MRFFIIIINKYIYIYIYYITAYVYVFIYTGYNSLLLINLSILKNYY